MGRHAEPTLRGCRGAGWRGSPSPHTSPLGTHWHHGQRQPGWTHARVPSPACVHPGHPRSPASIPRVPHSAARHRTPRPGSPGRVGAHPAPLEGLTQPGGGSQPSLPADFQPGCLFSELEGSAWPCQTPAGALRHAVPGLQSCHCLPEHVPQPALSWQEPALAPRPDFLNPQWRLTCSRNISRHFGSINSSGTGESRDPLSAQGWGSAAPGKQQIHPRVVLPQWGQLSTSGLPSAGLQTGGGVQVVKGAMDIFGREPIPPTPQRCFCM